MSKPKSSKPKVEPHCTMLSELLMVGISAVCYVLASWLWWEAVETPNVSGFTSLALMKACRPMIRQTLVPE
jgi:hypothetical protein